MPRKSKKQEPELVGMIGIGLDHDDEHRRITEGDAFVLLGGSEETHERLQDAAIHVTESLKTKGKRLPDAEIDEVLELLQKALEH